MKREDFNNITKENIDKIVEEMNKFIKGEIIC